MRAWLRYAALTLGVAVITHLGVVHAMPKVMMGAAIARLSGSGFNIWRAADRVTPMSRTIVRPSPDFAYFACAYDLRSGPVRLHAAPWRDYWSLSLYADNSDNFFVIDDREARNGATLTLIRAGRTPPEDVAGIVESPSTRGVALIRRLAPTPALHAAANEAGRADVCAPLAALDLAP